MVDSAVELSNSMVTGTVPEPFSAVGLWYIDFSQTTDEEVRYLLSTHYADGSRKRSA